MLNGPLQQTSTLPSPRKDTLNIWLITGVNGAGKPLPSVKLPTLLKIWLQMLNWAADTFRAAAVEQENWGSRSGIEVPNPGQNTDPAAVVFDAIAYNRGKQNYSSRHSRAAPEQEKLDGRTQQIRPDCGQKSP